MAPPQPRKGPVRVPQNPLMGGVLGSQMPTLTGAFSPPPSAPPAGSPLTGSVSNFYEPPQVPRSPLSLAARGGMLADQNRQNAGIERLTGQIQDTTRRSQIDNPMMPQSPSAGVPELRSPLAQSQMDYMQRQEAARQQNTRLGDFSPTAGQSYVNSLPMDQAGMASRLANRDAGYQPGGTQMAQRFAPQSPLGQQAAEYQRGQTGVDRGEGVFIQEGGYGSPQKYLQFNNTPEGAAEVAAAKALARREDRTAPGFRSEETRAAQMAKGLERRKAAIEAGLPKQRREAKVAALKERAFKRAVANGLNPLSAQAAALFPEAAGKFQASRRGGPAAAPPSPLNDPLRTGPGGTITAQDQANAEIAAQGLVNGVPGPPDKDGNPTPGTPGSPFLQTIGATGKLSEEPDLSNIHNGLVRSTIEGKNPITPTPGDLRDLRTYVSAMRTRHGDDALNIPKQLADNPAEHQLQVNAWRNLAEMPEDATDEQLMSWYTQWKNSISARIPQQPNTSPTAVRPNPGYAAPFSN